MVDSGTPTTIARLYEQTDIPMEFEEATADRLYARYLELGQYVGWTSEDARRVAQASRIVEPTFNALVEDFYAEIDRHPEARAVITGGGQQIERLRGSLRGWLTELFSGQYDRDYVIRRWRVGLRHVEIGLNQVYTNVAMSRLRMGLLTALEVNWVGELERSIATRVSLNKLLDLDLAIIEDAYQSEYIARQQRIERLAAIGRIAGGVAHELRNPLNVIKTSIYFILNAKNISQEKVVQHLERIERQVGLADKVITALSDFAKLPFPQVRPVSAAQCIEEALETSAIPNEIEVKIELSPDLPAVLADPDQLRIVLGNLLRNARDAMAKGGTLTIRGESCDGMVEFHVVDTGTGISPENLRLILEPLFSTKTRGLGLGLAITRAIIDKHHGQMTLQSKLGKGSEFVVRLPAAPSAGRDQLTKTATPTG
jgi:signal transduction histidine kinase